LLPALGNRKAADIKRKDIVALLDGITARPAPILANRVHEIVRRIYNWGIAKDRVASNPCVGIARNPHSSRDRVLTSAELRSLWVALAVFPTSVASRYKLQLLTAARPGEVRRMRWQDIDLDAGWWTIPSTHSKNTLTHRIPLSPPACAILTDLHKTTRSGDWVFPGEGGPLSKTAINNWNTKVRKAAGLEFKLHDLRRSAASHMAGAGTEWVTITKILNHSIPGPTAVYVRHGFDAEKAAALQLWARRLDDIVTSRPAPDNVVQLQTIVG
jgi:integrase